MEEGKWLVGETKTGKVLQVVRNPSTNLYILQYNHGGEIPKKLRGDWNNMETLMKLAKPYLDNLNENYVEESKDAESDSDEAVS